VDQSLSVEQLRAKTFEYLLLAAAEARSKLLPERARELASRALDIARNIDDRAAAHESLGMTALYSFAGDDAWHWLTQAVDERVEGGSADPQLIAMLCARAVEVPTRWPSSMTQKPDEALVARYLETGLENAGDEKSEGRFRLLLGKAFWSFAFPMYSDEADEIGRAAGEEARALAREMGRPDLECATLDALSSIDLIRGYQGRLTSIMADRIEIARTLIDPWEIGDAYQVAADTALLVGNYRIGLELAAEGYERSREGPIWRTCLAWRALAKFRLGDWEGMLADMRELELTPDPEAYWYFSLMASGAEVHQLRGNESVARGMLDGLGVEPGKQSRFRAVGSVARVLAMQGDRARALALLDATWDSRVTNSKLLESECDVVAITGAWERAPDTIARARANAEEAWLVALPLYADRLEGRTALASSDGAGAIDALVRARDGFESLGARWDAATSALSLGEALVAIGEAERARQELTHALAVFEELGSVSEAARARSLLETP
jgi:hypothetical protein